MRASQKAVLFLTLIALIGLVRYFSSRPVKSTETVPPTTAAPDRSPTPGVIHSQEPAQPVPERPLAETEEALDLIKLPRDKVEAWLARRNRDAVSLLAALHTTGDTNYLREAATNFPGNPAVQYSVLTRDLFPEERRKWLDAFKTSSPDNALPNYLSAADYFKNGQRDAAIAELRSAAGKSQFENYVTESRLNAEELCSDSGLSPTLSAVMAMNHVAEEFIPELRSMKQVATGVADAQKEFSAAGDSGSVQSLALMGLAMADQLRSGDSGKYVVRLLVGNASEALLLRQLDPNTSYDFLGGKTPTQRLEELSQWKEEFKRLNAGYLETFAQMSEAERANYAQRAKVFGEIEAMRWLQQQHGAAPAPPGGR